jgi:hypothetical protein
MGQHEPSVDTVIDASRRLRHARLIGWQPIHTDYGLFAPTGRLGGTRRQPGA